jgi:hypothetical protein
MGPKLSVSVRVVGPSDDDVDWAMDPVRYEIAADGSERRTRSATDRILTLARV